MSNEKMDLLRQAVRTMLATLEMGDIDDNELHDLTLCIGHTEIKGAACLKACPIIFERDEDEESFQITPPPSPSKDTSHDLRKSKRIASSTKRSYEGMQSRTSGTGRPRKQFKYTVQEVDALTLTCQSTLSPIDHAVDAIALAPARNTSQEPPNSEASTNALMDIIQEPTDNAASASSSTTSHPQDMPLCNSPTDESPTETTDIPAKNQPTNVVALCEDDPPAEPSATDCTEEITASLSSNEHTNVARPVLDESGNSLESVLEALKTQNTDRIADSPVPGTYDMLGDTEPMIFARIITSIGKNCVESSLTNLRSALEVEKDSLQEYERNKLNEIKEGRKQMNLFAAARTKREEEYRAEEEQLPKETAMAIARLSMKEIADRDLKDILSEPVELTREFKDEDEFENLIKEIDKANATDSKKRGRASMKEAYYWPIIQWHAKNTGPLPKSSGKKSGITAQEKDAAKRLVIALGYSCSRDSLLKARSYLKLLSDLREAGVTLLLLYRTKEFKTHFLRHPNDLSAALSWNQLYHPHILKLRLRAIAQAGGDFSGRCDLEDQNILHRLHIPPAVIWRDDLSEWADPAEKDKYRAAQSIKAISGKSNEYLLRYGIKGDVDSNKSIYVSMIPYEGISGKKTFGGKTPSAKLLAVSPLVSVSPGDFLGIVPGRLRYTDEKSAGAISGPVQGLWLDRSEVRGKLHWMKAAKPGEQTNVCLVWEGVNEIKGEKTFCQYWRILVVATRHIMPFDRLVRPA